MILDLAKQSPTKQFLGDEIIRDNEQNPLSKAIHTPSKKSEYLNVADFHPASVILQGLTDSGLSSPRLECSIVVSKQRSSGSGKTKANKAISG